MTTEADAVAFIDAHIESLCRQLGQTTDSLLLKQLRADVREAEARKKMVLGLLREARKREQKARAQFLLYQRGVQFKGEAVLLIAAGLLDLDPEQLSYEQFRGLLQDKKTWKLAKKVSKEIEIHELQQTARIVDHHRALVHVQVADRQRRYAERRLTGNRRPSGQDRDGTPPPGR